MKTRLLVFLTLVMASTLLAADDTDARFSPGAEKTAKSLRTTIKKEIKELHEHEWAGEYYAGDGLGANTSLVIAPKSGHVFEWHGCMGLYDRNYGVVAWTNAHILLSFTFKNQQKGFKGIAPEFIPVRWGQRRYLVPTNDMAGFCNQVNQKMEPRDTMHGNYLLRQGDEKVKVSGLPVLPKEYQAYLLTKPIEANIVAVGQYSTQPSLAAWKFKDTPVTLDAGLDKGLRVGMELNVIQPKNSMESVLITKVEAHRSEATMNQIGEETPGPKVGWRLSSQLPWKYAVQAK